MSEYIKVCVVDEIPVGEGRAFPVNEQLVAVFNQGEGQFRAIDDACPHQGASLAEGYVEGTKSPVRGMLGVSNCAADNGPTIHV